MKKIFASILAPLCVAVFLMLPGGAVFQVSPSVAASKVLDWNEAQIKWYSFSDGLREAKATGKPILAVFYADWCPHCLAHSRLFGDPRIVQLSQALIMVKVDSDSSPEINARYSPDGGYVPRTMVLKADGSLVTSLGGSNAKYRYFLRYESTVELSGVMRSAASVVRHSN